MIISLEECKSLISGNAGNLSLIDSDVTSLPDGLHVPGNLDLQKAHIERLPKALVVGGNLSVSCTYIKELPDDLSVGGNMDLSSSHIKRLPVNLSVSGNLNLSGCSDINGLPGGLTVNGDLNLSWTHIRSLPANLSVGGSLNLSYTKIKELPADLSVVGDIDLRGTEMTYEMARQLVEKNKSKTFNDWNEHTGITKEVFLDGIKWLCEEPIYYPADHIYKGKLRRELGIQEDGTLVHLVRVYLREGQASYEDKPLGRIWCRSAVSITAIDGI